MSPLAVSLRVEPVQVLLMPALIMLALVLVLAPALGRAGPLLPLLSSVVLRS